MRKTSRQLDREIAQSLSHGKARRSGLSHSTQLANWWRKATPEEDRVCYDTKTKALKAFLDTNYEVVQNYGGVDYAASPSEFDAINHKYNLQGKRGARTIAQAVGESVPPIMAREPRLTPESQRPRVRRHSRGSDSM